MNLSYFVLILALVLAFISVIPWKGASPSPWWYGSFFPASWFCFVLFLVLSHGGINFRG